MKIEVIMLIYFRNGHQYEEISQVLTSIAGGLQCKLSADLRPAIPFGKSQLAENLTTKKQISACGRKGTFA